MYVSLFVLLKQSYADIHYNIHLESDTAFIQQINNQIEQEWAPLVTKRTKVIYNFYCQRVNQCRILSIRH